MQREFNFVAKNPTCKKESSLLDQVPKLCDIKFVPKSIWNMTCKKIFIFVALNGLFDAWKKVIKTLIVSNVLCGLLMVVAYTS